MAVHKYERTRKGERETVYCGAYFAADGTRRVEKVRSIKATASAKDHADSEVAARAHANAQRRAIENGEWKDPRESKVAKLPFSKLADRFLREYRTRSGDMTHYTWRAKAWKDHFGDKPVTAITSADVEAFRRVREKAPGRRKGERVGAATIRKDLVSLSTLFRWAKARRLLDHNPADPDLVRRPAEPRGRLEYLSEDQEKKLLKACDPSLRALVQWALGTGMDREEVVLLTWGDVDEKAGVVHAPRGKTGIPREIPLNKTLRRLLKAAKRVRSISGGPRVFLGAKGDPLTVEGVKTALRRAYEAAELAVAGPFKVFRHTFASRLAMKGHSAPAIARLMGHATETITDRYMHLSPAYLREVMASLDGPKRTRKPAQRTAQDKATQADAPKGAAATA